MSNLDCSRLSGSTPSTLLLDPQVLSIIRINGSNMLHNNTRICLFLDGLVNNWSEIEFNDVVEWPRMQDRGVVNVDKLNYYILCQG
jgi:hypothetical protein